MKTRIGTLVAQGMLAVFVVSFLLVGAIVSMITQAVALAMNVPFVLALFALWRGDRFVMRRSGQPS